MKITISACTFGYDLAVRCSMVQRRKHGAGECDQGRVEASQPRLFRPRVRVSVIVNLANGTVLPVDTIELFDKGNGGELNFYTIIFRNAIIKLIFNFSSIYFDPKCMHNNNFHYM